MKHLEQYQGALILSVGADGGVPEWVRIFPRGWVETTRYPPFLVDDQAMEEMIAAWRDHGIDLVFDYEHQTMTGEKAPAAGWIKELEARADGLWGRVEWTDEARGYLEKREYRYHSPTFMVREQDQRAYELLGVSLTNFPATKHQQALVNKQNGGLKMEFLVMVCAMLGLAAGTDPEAALAAIKSLKAVADEARQALSLSADDGPEKIGEAVQALKGRAENAPPASVQVLSFLGLKEGANEAEVLAGLQSLKAGPDLAALQAEVTALKDGQRTRDVDDLTARALKEGKIAAAQVDWFRGYAKSDLKGATEYVAKAPRVVPVKDLPPDPGQTGETADGDLTDVQLMINKQLRISKETWDKYGPAGKA